MKNNRRKFFEKTGLIGLGMAGSNVLQDSNLGDGA